MNRYINIGDAAKSFGMGRNMLFKLLREKKILTKANLPLPEYVRIGYFVMVRQIVEIKGEKYTSFKTVLTENGFEWVKGIVNASATN